MLQTRRDFLRTTAAAAATGPFVRPRGAHAAPYAGKTLEVLVPFAPGGAVEVGARFTAPFLEKYMPGNPRVSVRTMPGGASILGANYFEANARPDGLLALCTSSSTSHPYMLGQQGVKYSLKGKRVGMTLSFGPVLYVSPATGVKSPADLLKTREKLTYGAIGATASDLPILLAFELLKLDVNVVLGFTGRGPIRIAFERGETNLDFQFTPVYLTQVVHLVQQGRAVPLMTGGALDLERGTFTKRDPVVSDLPSAYEAYKALHGQEPSGTPWDAYQASAALTFTHGLTWWLHGDTTPEILESWYEAVKRAVADPEFKEKSKSVTGGYPLYPGSQTEASIQKALHPSAEVTGWLKTLLSTKYKVKF